VETSYLGRAMAHEARHHLVPPHAVAGLGADSPDILDDKNYGEFSDVDQTDIINALDKLERQQSTARTLIPIFPQATRSDPTSFPF
jgi:hypothetical protein